MGNAQIDPAFFKLGLPLHITPCLAQGGDYGAAWKSVDYGEAACGPDRSPGWRAGIAGKPPGSDALYRSIDAIRPRHTGHITCLGADSIRNPWPAKSSYYQKVKQPI